MAIITRLYDFTPGTLIQSQQVDDEFNQILNLLSGVSSNKNVILAHNDGSTPPLTTNQTGAGSMLRVQKAGVTAFDFTNAGTLNIITGSIAPITVASNSLVCTNLDADKLDGAQGSEYVRNNQANQVVIDGFRIEAANPTLEFRDTTGGSADFILGCDAANFTMGFVGGSSLMTFNNGSSLISTSGPLTAGGLFTASSTSTFTGIATFNENVIITDDHLQINTTGTIQANNRLVVNYGSVNPSSAGVTLLHGAASTSPLHLCGTSNDGTIYLRIYDDGDVTNGRTDKFQVLSNGLVKSRAVLSTTETSDQIFHGGVTKTIVTQASNSGTSETDLHSITLPANLFSSNGDSVEFEHGIYLAGLGTQTVRMYFGGSTFLTMATTSGDVHVVVRGTVMRIDSDTVRTTCSMIYGGATGAHGDVFGSTGLFNIDSLNFTTSKIFKVTGQSSTSSNAVTITSTILKFWPANP
jgi:hypothetical protein